MLTIKRQHGETLRRWYEEAGRKPLIMRGARQVGKTTLVADFAKQQDIRLFVLNLEQYSELQPIFHSLKPDRLMIELALIFGVPIQHQDRSLLFLDEIQAIPEAIAMLRYIREKYPQLPVIAAGSLLEFALAEPTFSVPVGRIEYLFIGPVSFREFVVAANREDLVRYLDEYQLGQDFSPTVHGELLHFYRIFLIVGGMPEASREYLVSGDFSKVERIKSSIITTFREDFAKYAKAVDLTRLRRVFDYIPQSLGQKVIFTKMDQNSRAVDLRRCLDLIKMARIAVYAYHSSCSGIPIAAQKDDKIFKPYFLDCGLVSHMTGISNTDSAKLLDIRFITEGFLAEQYVAQHLQFQGPYYEEPTLLYWLREGKHNNAEVDFVVENDGLIIPVEIKSGTSGSLKSLHQFTEKHSSACALRFDLNPPSRQSVVHKVSSSGKEINFDLVSLPLYAIENWRKMLRS